MADAVASRAVATASVFGGMGEVWMDRRSVDQMERRSGGGQCPLRLTRTAMKSFPSVREPSTLLPAGAVAVAAAAAAGGSRLGAGPTPAALRYLWYMECENVGVKMKVDV